MDNAYYDLLSRLCSANEKDLLSEIFDLPKEHDKKEIKKESPIDLIKNGDLCVFSVSGKIIYTIFLNDQFLYVARKDSFDTLYEGDLVAIYEYPTSKLNELFWDQRPSDKVLANKKNLVWSKEKHDSEYKMELDNIDNAMKKLQEYRKKVLDKENKKGTKLSTSGFEVEKI